MLKWNCLTRVSHLEIMGPCDPDFQTVCGPDVGTDDCAPEVSLCGPDYGQDCMPDCDPADNW